MEAKAEYEKRVKAYLLDRTWYKVVDALEECTDFWSFGRNYYLAPNYNSYIPTNNYII